MIYLEFKINTIEREKELADFAAKQISFFKKNDIKFSLSSSSVEREYDIKSHNAFCSHLKSIWKKYGTDFNQKLSDFFNLREDLHITVRTTRYGALGYYNNERNEVYVNMFNNKDFDFLSLIKHELIHLVLQPFVEKYKLDHQKKEALVSTIVSHLS